MKTVFIVDEIGKVVEKTNSILSAKGFGKTVYYKYGHPKEVNNYLQELSNSPTEKGKKFPLIILVTDVPIKRDILGMYGRAKMQILICTFTEATYKAEQRTEINFKPILHPIKEAFIKALETHRGFTFETVPTFEETDCYFFGSQLSDKNVFNDRVDLIELKDLIVNITAQIC